MIKKSNGLSAVSVGYEGIEILLEGVNVSSGRRLRLIMKDMDSFSNDAFIYLKRESYFPNKSKFFVGLDESGAYAIFNIALGKKFTGDLDFLLKKIIEFVREEYIPSFDACCLPESEQEKYITFAEGDYFDMPKSLVSSIEEMIREKSFLVSSNSAMDCAEPF